MVKKVVLLILLILNIKSYDLFEANCIYCHKMMQVSLKDMFFKYLLKYSSENTVKLVMFYYLKEPKPELSVMPKEYIKIFGIKDKSDLSEEELKKAIDIYWDRYKVFGKIK